jgi:hypothetical protein
MPPIADHILRHSATLSPADTTVISYEIVACHTLEVQHEGSHELYWQDQSARTAVGN